MLTTTIISVHPDSGESPVFRVWLRLVKDSKKTKRLSYASIPLDHPWSQELMGPNYMNFRKPGICGCASWFGSIEDWIRPEHKKGMDEESVLYFGWDYLNRLYGLEKLPYPTTPMQIEDARTFIRAAQESYRASKSTQTD